MKKMIQLARLYQRRKCICHQLSLHLVIVRLIVPLRPRVAEIVITLRGLVLTLMAHSQINHHQALGRTRKLHPIKLLLK
jgi:hypothetical protein